jgi:hypothetical protein
LSYFGYEFEVPWKASFKERVGKGLVALQFQSGQDIVFSVPANQRGLLTELVQDESMHMQNLGAIFGDLMNRSAYDQYSALLNTTPSSIRAFGPRAESARGTILLTLKAITMGPGLGSGAFTFELPGKRGFQVGDPRKSKRVDIELFDSGGRYVEFSCATTSSSVKLSQPELNRILKSIHAVSGQSAGTQTQGMTKR